MDTQQGSGPGVQRSARGFTLIELMVSFSALMIVLLGFSRMLLSSHMASSTSAWSEPGAHCADRA